ncbi:MAG: cytochrome c biogenesis protein ResB [Pseudobdellovibrionaceae bacterium]
MAVMFAQPWFLKFKKYNRPFASLKLAVAIVVAIAVLTAIGTFVEASYDAFAAKKLVYDTYWMYGILFALSLSLIAVMIDRLPWKKRHLGFILAHIGILMIIAGSIQTLTAGIDGSMRIDIGGSSSTVSMPETEINVYSSFDGDRYTNMFSQQVDFFSNPPSVEKAMTIPLLGSGGDTEVAVITEYKKYVVPQKEVVAVEVKENAPNLDGAGLKIQVFNDRVNEVNWLVQRKKDDVMSQELGLARFILGSKPNKLTEVDGVSISEKGRNEIYFLPKENGVEFALFHKDKNTPLKTGSAKEGDVIDLGWMDLKLRVLRYLPHAKEEWTVLDKTRPTPLTTSAIKLTYNKKEHWVLLNDVLKIFTQNAVFLIVYGQRRIDLGFPIVLKEFHMDKYQGTNRAMSYKSQVDVAGLGEREISMNEPLKHAGFTFYQASFQDDETTGKPIASILSVNRDPGRFLKYLGSLVMTFGTILLFYFRRQTKSAACQTKSAALGAVL